LLNLIPVVADAAPGSYNSGADEVEALLSPLTAAILVDHIGGEPADVVGIAALAERQGIPLIEDCSQSHGATLHGQPVGTFGALSVFSTMHGKHHSTGGQGGVVFTRDEARYHAVRRASDRGKPFFLPPGTTNVVASLNLNLNDLAAAIGRVQLRKLPRIVRRRRAIVSQLADRIVHLRCTSIPDPIAGAEPSYWFLRMRYHTEAASCDKETYCQALAAEGLPVAADYRAALPHTMDWFQQRRVFGSSGYPWSSPDYAGDADRTFPCPNAQAAMDAHYNLYLHEGWQDADIDDAAAILDKVDRAYALP